MSDIYNAIGLSGPMMTLDSIEAVFNASDKFISAILNYSSHDDLNRYFSISKTRPIIIDSVIESGGYLSFSRVLIRSFIDYDREILYHNYKGDDGQIVRAMLEKIPYKYGEYVAKNITSFLQKHGHIYVDHYDKSYKMWGKKYHKGMDVAPLMLKKIQMKGDIYSCILKSHRAGILTYDILKMFYNGCRVVDFCKMSKLCTNVDMTAGGRLIGDFMNVVNAMKCNVLIDVTGSFKSLAMMLGGGIGAYDFKIGNISGISLSVAAVRYRRTLCDPAISSKELSLTASLSDMITAVTELDEERKKL